MPAMEARRRIHALWFAGITCGVYAAALAIAARLPHLGRSGPVALGLTLDMVVVVPLAFYFLLVRRTRLPLAALVPVLVLSVLAASRVLPAEHQYALRLIEWLAAPAEVALIVWIVWRAAVATRQARHDPARDPIERIRLAAFEATRSARFATLLATEIAVCLYALGSWRTRPHVPPGTRAVTLHERSGHGGIVLAFLMLFAVEGLAVHAMLFRWNPFVAWMFTIGSAYAGLWLIADYRATVLRPILVGDDDVLIRAGFRCTLRVPRADIADVSREKPAFGRGSVKLTVFSTPTRWITFSTPVQAEGPYGIRRRVRAIGIEPDQTAEIDRLCDARG